MTLRHALRLVLWGEPISDMSLVNMTAGTCRVERLMLRWHVAGRLHELALLAKEPARITFSAVTGAPE